MLGILLIYFIGKHFYRLAEEFNKNKWLFAVLGVIMYYIGTAIGGVILGIADGLLDLGFDWENTLVLSLIALPFGIGTVYLFHFLLKKHWKDVTIVVDGNEIQDIGKPLE